MEVDLIVVVAEKYSGAGQQGEGWAELGSSKAVGHSRGCGIRLVGSSSMSGFRL